jgi:hypothetical protein
VGFLWFGMSMAARYYVGYAYNIEVQPKTHVVLVSTTMFLGESIIQILCCLYFWKVRASYKYLQIPGFILLLIAFIFLIVSVESPRWLVSKKNFKAARETFAKIGRWNGLNQETINLRLSEIHFDGELINRDNSIIGFFDKSIDKHSMHSKLLQDRQQSKVESLLQP